MNVITSIFLCFAFCIPSLGTTSPLKECNGTLRERQAIVDTEELALYERYGSGHAIGDHVGSEIGDAVWDMSLVSVGDIGILYTENGAEYYECTAVITVKRGKYNYTWRGKAIYPDKHDIVCLSCVEGSDDYENLAYFDYCFTEP